MNHGSPTSTNRHVGDLGNIVSTSATGVIEVSITDSIISLQDGNIANILNRAIVIHEGPDDFVASGCTTCSSRVACGIIEPCDATCQQLFAL